MVKDSKMVTGCMNEGNRLIDRGAFSIKLRRHGCARNERPELLLAHFSKPIQVRGLSFQVIISPIEPISPVCSAMNSKRSTNGVPKFSLSQLIVLREDFDSLRQASASDAHSEFQRQVVDVDSALPR